VSREPTVGSRTQPREPTVDFVKSNNQLCVGLGLFLSLESTSAHHKWRGHAVCKVITLTSST